MIKTRSYIALIIALMGANLLLFFSDAMFGSEAANNVYFDFADAEIVSLKVENEDNTILLRKNDERWVLNEKHQADQGFVSTLLSVFRRLEKGRTMGEWKGEVLGEVSITLNDATTVAFQYATNPNRTKTYFISEDQVIQVAVPGYRDNVADIFQLHPDQWRDRLVIDGSWRTIQGVQVDKKEGSFSITFEEEFFLLNGEAPQDSSAVIDYLNQFQMFQANEMISPGRFEVLDSIARTHPISKISIDDIKSEEPTVLNIYPQGKGQNYHLLIDEKGRRMVIDGARIRKLLTSPGGLQRR